MGSLAMKHSPGVRVMVVDDSIVARAVFARMLEAEPDMCVVAEARSGLGAIEALGRQSVDLVLLDLEMPEMGGLEALPQILERGCGARVMVVSSACREGADASIHALRLGAVDTMLKPGAGRLMGGFSQELIEKVRRIVGEPVAQAPIPAPVPIAPTVATLTATAEPIECIAIGSSTGGVHALADFFAALPASVGAPILVTQHLPAPFMQYFAGQLQDMSGRPTRLAVDGMVLAEGQILLAPGDAHLGLARTRGVAHVKLERRRMPSGCTPSVDPMLSAVGRVFGAAGMGVILSGMGRDGELGAADLVSAGGEVIAQDAATSVVWGMPGAVATAGIAKLVAPPATLAAEIARRCEMKKDPAWT